MRGRWSVDSSDSTVYFAIMVKNVCREEVSFGR